MAPKVLFSKFKISFSSSTTPQSQRCLLNSYSTSTSLKVLCFTARLLQCCTKSYFKYYIPRVSQTEYTHSVINYSCSLFLNDQIPTHTYTHIAYKLFSHCT